MENIVYVASCPICGRLLFKGKPNSQIEVGCPKCKNYLHVEFTTEGVQSEVSIIKEEK
jgi:phage FluMu protein Com